jgi:acetate kinase
MGFSPLEGLVMATRSGDIDPGIITYIQHAENMTSEETDKMLNMSSGLLGLSGISGDMRALLESNEPAARLAIDIYSYRIRKYIGAYMAVLGGVDGILFGGGIGENAPVIREKILDGMQWLGIHLNFQNNGDIIAKEGRISTSQSQVDVWVIPIDEAAVLAEEALTVLTKEKL